MNKKAYIILGFILTSIFCGITILNVSAEKVLAQKLDEIGNIGNLPTEYNPRDEFALTQGGANGLWNYGTSTSDADNTLTLFADTDIRTEASGCGGGAFEKWLKNPNGDQLPQIARHNPAATCANIPATAVFMHPGTNNQRVVLRFNVPMSGTFQLTGTFQKQALSATTDLKIIKNGGLPGEIVLYTGAIGAVYQQAFNLTATLAAGDKIDFSVGDGDNGQNSDGSTLAVTISQPITACLPAPANLQVNVPAENSPIDVQSVNTNASFVGDAAYTNMGKVGRAFEFDGNGDYVRVEDNAAQRPATAVTVEGWFKFDSIGGLNSLVSKPLRNSAFNSYDLYVEGGQLRGFVGNTSQFTRVFSNFTPQVGVWHHLAFTYNFSGGISTLRLYANGADVTSGQDGTANLPLFYDANPHPLIIGGEYENNAPGFFFNGQADEISIYGRALPSSEIFDLVQQGSFGKCSPANCVESPNNLVSWFAGEQSALDSRSDNHGALQNGTTFQVGRVGQSFNFDGFDDRVVVPNSPSLDITGNQLTIEAWINTAVSGGDRQIVSMADGTGLSDRKFGLSVTSDLLSFEVETTNGRVEAVVGSIPVGVWTHVAGVYNGSQMIWYINGNAVLSAAQTGNIVPSASNLYIGQFAVGGFSTFNGAIDELGIYNRGLSQTEIQSIYNAGQSGKCKPSPLSAPTNQIAWYSGDGDTRDFLGSNPNGILRGDTNYRIGRVGQSFNFDGNGDYVEIADDADHRPANITIEGWFKANALANFPHLVSKPLVGSTSNSYAVWYDGGQLRGGHGNNSGGFDSVATGFTPNIGEWYHFAYTIDDAADTHRFYINGVQIATAATTLPIFYDASPLPLIIGAEFDNSPTANYFFNGQEEEISLYSRELSASEIAAVYNAGSAGKLKSVPTNVNFAKNAASLAPTTVQLSDASVNFAQVTTAGITSQNNIDLASLPKLPSSAVFTGLAYDISTTAVYQNGSPNDVQVCFNVPALNNFTFTDLRILHLEGGNWVDRTANGNISPNLCTNNLTSLSPFVIVESVVPTAASAEISGKVTDSTGQGLNGVTVKLTDTRGNEIFRKTNNFGKYIFDNVAGGEFYIVSVGSKKYTFTVNSRAVVLNEAAENIDFVSVENVDLSENDVRKRP